MTTESSARAEITGRLAIDRTRIGAHPPNHQIGFGPQAEGLLRPGPHAPALAGDVAATKRVLDLQQGPILLVGHSYGGVVITEAGSTPNVAGLVYIAAFIPDQGESAVGLLSQATTTNDDMRATKDDFLYLDPTAFPADFAADLPPAEANFMARGDRHRTVAIGPRGEDFGLTSVPSIALLGRGGEPEALIAQPLRCAAIPTQAATTST